MCPVCFPIYLGLACVGLLVIFLFPKSRFSAWGRAKIDDFKIEIKLFKETILTKRAVKRGLGDVKHGRVSKIDSSKL